MVCLVAGPGYGKTAFIVDLLSSLPGRTVYFSVDEGDRDPVRFLTYLMAGLGMEPAGSRPRPVSGLVGPGQPDASCPGPHRRHWWTSSRAQAGQTHLLAIDDFHLVDSSPAGGDRRWSSSSAGCRRAGPYSCPRGARCRCGLTASSLGGRLVHLHGRDLRLTPREVAAWAAQNWAVTLQPSEARALWRLTEGWPAALVLLGQHLLSGGPM